jgi:hypothetical protein
MKHTQSSYGLTILVAFNRLGKPVFAGLNKPGTVEKLARRRAKNRRAAISRRINRGTR